jgi:hypothetical protein
LGNHRAVIEVPTASDAVLIDFLWRRHDAAPEQRRMMIVNAGTGREVVNILRLQVDNERCKLVFGPVATPGLYHFYYLPYSPVTNEAHCGEYLPVESAPDSQWRKIHEPSKALSEPRRVDKGKVLRLESRTAFHSFYPMEVVATKDELRTYLGRQRDDYLFFAEDRSLPIRMLDAVPVRWTQRLPFEDFRGEAQKNEYFTFQLGLFAARRSLQNIKLEFSDLRTQKGDLICRGAFTCFNTAGVDMDGKPFTIQVDVKQGSVKPLWIGLDIPQNVEPGTYEGFVTVGPEGLGKRQLRMAIKVSPQTLADRGDGEPWRHSRLRWLNSTLGISDEAVAPYTPLTVSQRRISCLGRSVELNDYGLPASITSRGGEILGEPIRFVVDVDNQPAILTPSSFSYTKQKGGIVTWQATCENTNLTLVCNGEMEFDGRLSYRCTILAKTDLHAQDIRLELPIRREFATYMVGMGRMGGLTPGTHLSRWMKTEDSFWIGETTGGIQCELRGGTYNGPLRNIYQPNPSLNGWIEAANTWANGRSGGFRIDSNERTITASGFTGPKGITKGESASFEFALLITPVKDLDLKHQFSNRYVQGTDPSPGALAHGGNVMNVHHATPANPYINYPFIALEEMRQLVQKWHERGWKVKIYYTVRELSDHLAEIWALRSLGHEILADGPGGGYQWLREHIVTNYTRQWYTHLGHGDVDAAILNRGESRYYNYYVEGVNWLVKNMGIDGLYLDDVSYDRRVLKRMRKVMEMNKPGCMIDLHSNTQFSGGPANQYMEYFPYIDKTIFGEGFLFNLMPPEYWLVEASGIPFGIMNDIFFQDAVNNRRGMVYGMAARVGTTWPMWKLWDDFGIADSRMMGYWEKTPVVTTDHTNILATVYSKKNSALVAVGSWLREPAQVKLNIDWKRLGLNPSSVRIRAPEIDGYQKERTFQPGELIPVGVQGDCLILLSN